MAWQDAGRPFALNIKAVPGISLINDALAAAFIHDVDPSRRHLIVAFTDGLECGSVVDRTRLIEVGSRADAVVHVVFGHGEGQLPRDGVVGWCTPSDPDGATALKTVAARTGGEAHQARFGTPSVRAFEGILRDFRQSYVLRYSPRDAPGRGWHQIRVEVRNRPDLTIRARPGYFGGT